MGAQDEAFFQPGLEREALSAEARYSQPNIGSCWPKLRGIRGFGPVLRSRSAGKLGPRSEGFPECGRYVNLRMLKA